jgi:eukaryotic-like serine/threonine-protein kinase
MTFEPDSKQDGASWSWLQQLIDQFEEVWKSGREPVIDDYLPAPDQDRLLALAELIPVDLERRYKAGAPRPLEHYLKRYPQLAEYRATVVTLIATDYSLRRRFGPATHLDEYCQRFPQLATELQRVLAPPTAALPSDKAADVPTNPPTLPPRDDKEADPPPRLGRFRILARIGAGGFGTVYRAYDDELRRDIAIKVPHRHRVATPQDAEAYLREARILADLKHPGLLPVYDVGRTDDGRCYLVCPFVEATDLASRIKNDRPRVTESVRIVVRVAEALHHAHQKGLIHRDVKPANILLQSDGHPVVADFGLALRAEDFARRRELAGTPAYMSPEQARCEGHRIDARTDVFSLGIVFYELLTGRRPFSGNTVSELLEQIKEAEPRPPRQLDDSIPRELDRICQKALSKRLSDRYSTARDLADDLRAWRPGSKSHAAVNVQVVMPSGSGVALAGVASTVRPADDTHKPAPKIISKGLRPFEAQDAEFFLELLPGPRGRDGLPDSIRFWKGRIEETDPDDTFSVGLLFGPSGCGKSSFVKAGLLPHLAGHVLPLYLEATPEDTEARLLRRLHKCRPELPPDVGLVEALTCLRTQRDGPSAKAFIILDQFEQWLHAKPGVRGRELLEALRQCDGQHVQCLLMVRDDFWSAAQRFLDQLDVRLVDGQNSAMVDLFDPLHARKVLAEFGRAFGVLPEALGELTQEQERFLDLAIDGLTRDGKVFPVRLSLFAEMVKGRRWTPATLRKVGGIEGIGVTFLEENFSASDAPPEHRIHQHAARTVLKALLPPLGSPIKGPKRNRGQLLAASGYAKRPRDFEDLLRILDTKLRLVTPTDPEQDSGVGDPEPGEEEMQVTAARKEDRSGTPRSSVPISEPLPSATASCFYQLTHDYLVPALERWLTQKQRETLRGRAELRLADRASLWEARPQNRHLPAWWEWINILLFTRRRDWSAPQERMMVRATRHHVLQTAVLAAILGAVALTASTWYRHIRVSALVDQLKAADIREVPAIVTQLDGYRPSATSRLRALLNESAPDSKAHLHTAIALVSVDPGQVRTLVDRLLRASPGDEFIVIRNALAEYSGKVTAGLWATVEDGQALVDQRFRAACALAHYVPDDRRWEHLNRFVAERLVAENALHATGWEKALQSLRGALLEPLATIFRDTKRSEAQRNIAASFLADFAAGDPEFLAGLLKDAGNLRQYEDLFSKLQAERQRTVELMRQELEKTVAPDPTGANDQPARRQALSAVTLARLNQAALILPGLQLSPDPRVRSWLIDCLAHFGVEPRILVHLLEHDTDPGVQAALTLCLGEFDEKTIAEAQKKTVIVQLLNSYQNNPDPGLHSSAEWLLRHWGKAAELDRIDKELRSKGPVPARRWYINQHGDAFAVFPGPVEFQMGSPAQEQGREPTDESSRRMRIGRSFAVATKKVTVSQFKEFLQECPEAGTFQELPYSPYLNGPVCVATWYQAAMYCNWLSQQEGIPEDQWCYPKKPVEGTKILPGYLSRTGYRLPTEAEWECACRGGAITRRPYGSADELLVKYAWYRENVSDDKHRAVAMLRPNDSGLFDALGNAYDWCQDRWRPPSVALVTEDLEDPGPVNNTQPRVMRGGCYANGTAVVRSASRNPGGPGPGSSDPVGIRVARTIR